MRISDWSSDVCSSDLDAAVADYVTRDPGFPPFFRQLTDMLTGLLPRYEREGKSYLTIAVACTGGRHRPGFLAERLAAGARGSGRPYPLHHRHTPPHPPPARASPATPPPHATHPAPPLAP